MSDDLVGQVIKLVAIEHDGMGRLQVTVPQVRRNRVAMQQLMNAFAHTQAEHAPRGTWMINGWEKPWQAAAAHMLNLALRAGALQLAELEDYIKEVASYD